MLSHCGYSPIRRREILKLVLPNEGEILKLVSKLNLTHQAHSTKSADKCWIWVKSSWWLGALGVQCPSHRDPLSPIFIFLHLHKCCKCNRWPGGGDCFQRVELSRVNIVQQLKLSTMLLYVCVTWERFCPRLSFEFSKKCSEESYLLDLGSKGWRCILSPGKELSPTTVWRIQTIWASQSGSY